MGMRGRRDVLAGFTWKKAATRMHARLKEVYGSPPPSPKSRELRKDPRRRSTDSPGRRICMVVPSWGKRCGISDYSRSLQDRLGPEGVVAQVLPSGSSEALRESFDRHAFDLVHFQYEYVLYDTAELVSAVDHLRFIGIPAIVTAHDFAAGFARQNKVIATAFSRVIVHSSQAKEAYHRAGAALGRVVVIPMGCTRYLLEDEATVRHRLGVGPGPAVGFFGFMLPHKGIIELALAARALRDTYPTLKCYVFSSAAPYASSRAYECKVHEAVAQLGLREAVALNQDYLPEAEIASLLHAMDVNVLPYRDHGFIGTSAAARTVMAARKPMIVTDVPFFSDLGPEVYKIPSRDPSELAAAIRRLLEDDVLRKKLTGHMDDALERLDWSVAARQHALVYRESIEEASGNTGFGARQGIGGLLGKNVASALTI